LLGVLFAGLFSCANTDAQSQQYKRSETDVAVKESLTNIIHLGETKAFDDTVLGASIPVLVDFWAPWCGPCRAQEPVLEEFAEHAGDRVRIVKVNVDEHERLARRFRIVGIPTMVLFDEGRETKRLVGVHSLDRLKKVASL
jgi:thioredoxin 1